MASPARRRAKAVALLSPSALLSAEAGMCAGKFMVSGHGTVSLTNAGANTPGEDVGLTTFLPPSQVEAHLGARTYFSDSCTEGIYSNAKYSAMKLLGKRLSFTTDVSSAGCGCNAAFYLVSMRQNPEVSSCSDYYCDANKVCGVPCAEVDIMEASKRAWHSTLHASTDSGGLGGGYGGGATWNGPRDFNAAQYGPGSTCIDTLKPVDVQVEFPMAAGQLQAMVVTLNQKGRNCPLKINLANYPKMDEISAALGAGMTPVISYWKSADMLWMDGKGSDGQGPCAVDAQSCGESAKFYDFKVEELPGTAPPPVQPLPGPGDGEKKCTPWGKDCRESLCCLDETSTCYEKNQWWASCKKECIPGIDPLDTPENQQPWSCKELGSPKKPPKSPEPPATKIVILRVPARDIWPGLGDGSTVTLSVGDHHVKAEVVSVKAGDGQEGRPAPGGFNSTALWVTLLVLALVLATAGLLVHYRSHLREQDILAMTERAVQVSRDTGRSALESFHSWTAQGQSGRPNPSSPRAAAEPPRSFMQNLSAWFQQVGGARAGGAASADADSRPPHRPMRRVEQQSFLW